jgi:hypothetical protein
MQPPRGHAWRRWTRERDDMSTFMNNGLSGLLASQRAIQVTSNNVANANT